MKIRTLYGEINLGTGFDLMDDNDKTLFFFEFDENGMLIISQKPEIIVKAVIDEKLVLLKDSIRITQE